MNPVIEKWADALESGEYKQGYEQLRSLDNKFCALGVLCDLAAKEGIIDEPELIDGQAFSGYRYDEMATSPSTKVRDWAQFYAQYRVMHMNDDKHNKFKTIAKWLRETYE